MKNNRAIIIGSGVAGLAAAIRLAVAGMEVIVYEKNAYPGGKVFDFKMDGFHFDAGPSLFTQPVNIEELFILANEPLQEYFKYLPVDTSCTYFFNDGKIVQAYTGADKFAAELATTTGQNESAVIKYLTKSKKLYDNLGSVFLNHSLHKTSTWLHPRIIKAFTAIRYPYLFTSLSNYNNRCFTTPETRQIFNRYATYNGSNPFKAPAMLSIIPHLEHNEGAFYPTGGMISITNALYKLAVKKGVQFNFNKEVERIIHSSAKIEGVVVNGENIPASIVISNADVYFTFNNLLRHHAKAKRILKQERSSSALIFYWGIKQSNPKLGLHNIFFSADYKKEFTDLFKNKILNGDPTVYVNITAKMEPAHAPAGKENWFVMINVPANTGQNWKDITENARSIIIKKLSAALGVDVETLIETEAIMDPVMIEEKTGSYMGSLYGTSSNTKMAAFKRHPNFTSFAKGMYFCGGSVHPGGGIPLCLKSAKIVEGLIKKDFKIAAATA